MTEVFCEKCRINPSEVLFHAKIKVSKHTIKKNNRPIFKNRGTGRAFLGKSESLRNAESYLLSELRREASSQGIREPFRQDLRVVFMFYFSRYYTKSGIRNKKLPDLSNLYQLPEDVLQAAGIIMDDNLICSHDGSARMPASQDWLEIFILKHEPSWEMKRLEMQV